MQVSHPIAINLLDFFTTGRFDYIELGQTKDWIINNFPDPDIKSNALAGHVDIWKYGDLEFHFVDDRLWMIFCDYLTAFQMGKVFKVDLWFLEDYSKLTLLYVISQLNQQRVDFRLENQGNDIRLALQSGVELGFLLAEDRKDVNNAHLIYFSFSHTT